MTAFSLGLMAVATITAWVYIIARAKGVSFVCDEALSYGIIHGDPTFVDTPNNQWINTFLMRVSQHLFGESEMALRLPNVVVFGLYGAASLALLARLRHLAARVACFALLLLNPFLLEFFGLARGYGLSLAFSVAAIASLFVGRRSTSVPRELSRLAATGTFGALAFYANFSALNLALALLGIELIDLFFMDAWRARRWSGAHLAAIAIVGASAASLIPGVLHLRHLQEIGQLYYGGHAGFVTDTIGSLLRSSSCGFDCQPSWLGTGQAAVVVVALLALVWTTWRWVRRPRWSALTRAGVLFTTVMLATQLEATVLGTLYPLDRTALVYVVVFAVFVAFAIDDVVAATDPFVPRIAISAVIAFFAIIAAVNFERDANLTYTTVWAYDASSREVIDAMVAFEQRHGRPSVPWKLVSGFPRDESLNAYYRSRFHLDWLQAITRDPVSTPNGNLYYVGASELQEIPPGTTLLKSFASTGTQLRLAHPGRAHRRHLVPSTTARGRGRDSR